MRKIEDLKEEFLISECWTLTINGAFQHVSIYKKEFANNEGVRKEFRDSLRTFIEQLVPQYAETIDEKQHLHNIQEIINFSNTYHKDLLKNEKLNFGVSQKLLNLYLKYLWCLGKIVTPPHFPVDRIIQSRLEIKEKDIVCWSKMEKKEEYLNIITQVSQGNYAEWELEEWSKAKNS
ncbi:MAG: hypothetical protein ACRC3G_09195 [Bacteroidales bacterium]